MACRDVRHDSMRLLGKPRNEIEADIANPGGTKNWNRAIDVFAAMHAARGFQFFIHKGLRRN